MKKRLIHSFFIGIGIAAVLSIIYLSGFFANWQDTASDQLFPARQADPAIAIISIDDKSIQAIGRWPWDRSEHARLLDKLGNLPAVIGYDVSFPEASTAESDLKLAKAIQLTNRVVLPAETNSIQPLADKILLKDLLVPIPELRQHSQIGLVNMLPDQDNVTRRTPIVLETPDRSELRNFSEEILSLYYKSREDPSGEDKLKNIPVTRGFMRINYVGRPFTFKHYSFADVLDGTIPASEFTDKIVLVGATAPDLHDNQLTPVSQGLPMSGVEIHANVIQTILTQHYLQPESTAVTLLTIFLMCSVVSVAFIIFSLIPGLVVLLVALFGYATYAIISFDKGTIHNLIFPIFGILIAYVTASLYKYYVENRQKRFIRKAFSYYVSESVMRDILDNPNKLSLGGERKEVTVMFTDVAGFTSISEQLPPEQLANMLNNYLTRMTKIVFDHKGVLDKFIGDAVMAFWGAPISNPKHALNACETAIQMMDEIERIRVEWKELKIGTFDVRIGINTGEMVVGNMGSDLRFDYTLLGDHVNLGSRLEGINKEYGTRAIISQFTYDQVKDHVVVRKLDRVAVKGKAKSITIYELRGMGKATGFEKQFLNVFEEAYELYHKGDFAAALVAFKALNEKYPEDNPTVVYIKRCEEFVADPPENWDGIFYAQKK